MTEKWIVNVKGEPNGSPFEISVLRSCNEIGINRFGRFGLDKHMISSSGQCNDCVTKPVWDRLLIVAQEYADELNGNGF